MDQRSATAMATAITTEMTSGAGRCAACAGVQRAVAERQNADGGAKVRVCKVLKAKPFRKLAPDQVYIGRGVWGFRASKWLNPFVIGPDGAREEVIAKYRAWIATQPELMAALPELRGKDLVCWCAPEPCHGDVLLELASTIQTA
jgi:hypothetical protein